MRLKWVWFSFVFLVHPLRGMEKDLCFNVSEIVTASGVSPKSSACMVMCLEDNVSWVSGGERIKTQYVPASTAKIPHSLIALEEGYVDGPETLFHWDGKKRFLEVWNQDQTFKEAFSRSAVWVYQKVVCGIGYEVMSKWIRRLDYGNRDIGNLENLSSYWLDGPLKTSVEEQIAFLSKLAQEKLPFSSRTFRQGKLVMMEDSGKDWILYGKTGFSQSIGWYVGWLEVNSGEAKKTYVFAFNMDIENWNQLPKRKEVVREIFRILTKPSK